MASAVDPGSAAGRAGAVGTAVLGAADLATFLRHTARGLRGVWRHGGEVLRQVGILITGSALVLAFMQLVTGAICGLEADYFTRALGARAYAGTFTAVCDVRELGPMFIGFIFAAKVGCGLVAEVGSMRINEEIDALEAQGIDPMSYVIATRLVAVWIFLPFMYAIGLAVMTLGNYLVLIEQLGGVSQGTWERTHWGFQNPTDLLLSHTKVLLIGTVVTLIALYHGFRARMGPVGVGTATARSMIQNLIVVVAINETATTGFWGLTPRMPVGG